MEYISMVILAKSYKPGGRCIAGKQVAFNGNNSVTVGDWIRPVTNINGEEGKGAIPKNIYSFDNYNEMKVLDIVKVPVIDRVSVPGQPENMLIDDSVSWVKESSFTAGGVQQITDAVSDLWLEDYVPSNIVSRAFDEKGLVKQSLILIKPSNLVFTLSNDLVSYSQMHKKKITASFTYNNHKYVDFRITDPAILNALKNKYPSQDGQHVEMTLFKGDNYTLCLSLTPRFGRQELHYKLITSVFDYDGYLQQRYAA
jgi:hypothetical protein